MKRITAILLVTLGLAAAAPGAVVLVEAEMFQKQGGWVLDQQFMDLMGSPYLLAHGLGEPVADATTTVELPKAGPYRVWVRTMDWVARWKAPGSPGKFQVLVDGKPLEAAFGTQGAAWHWQDGGTVELPAKFTLALHDLTGFAGRCDAVVFSDEKDFTPPHDLAAMDAWRRKLLGLDGKIEDAGAFDLVVIGGGMAGTCAAVSAARMDLKVALVQDRPVLGGNNSSEVRVWLGGKVNLPPFPRIGDIVNELDPRSPESPGTYEQHGDEKKMAVVRREKNLSLFLNCRGIRVEMDGKRIRAVIGRNTTDGRELRFAAPLFVDCTGDGTIGVLAGADHTLMREGHMGPTNGWRVVDTGSPAAFPRCPWALDLSDKPFPTELPRLGKWFWESGFSKHPIDEMEYVRDYNLRAMFGAWDALKNVRKLYPNHKLEWAAYVAGKRESRQLLGDVILNKDHVMNSEAFPDGCVPSTWHIDLHVPETKYAADFPGEEFISKAIFTPFKTPYAVPYRCFYSRNVPNLFMAGRNVSVTHEALGTVRVMRTGGMMGEVVGKAAALCKQHKVDPRGVYEKHLDEFKALLAGPPAPEDAWLKTVGRNVAPQAKLTTSGDSSKKSAAELLVDGEAPVYDNAKRWTSKAAKPVFVEFSWKEPVNLSALRICSGYNVGNDTPADPIEDFVLQVAEGDKWVDVAETRTAGNHKITWSCTFKPVKADRVRLLITRTKGDVARIWEISLHEPK